MTKKQPTTATPDPGYVTKPLSQAQVRKLLAEGREVRRELERRIEKMHRISPAAAAARAR